MAALKEYFTTPREVLRRIPARYLRTDITFRPLAEWLAPALVSEIVDLSFDEFAEQFRQARSVPDEDWELFEREARQVLAKADEFNQMLLTRSGINKLLA